MTLGRPADSVPANPGVPGAAAVTDSRESTKGIVTQAIFFVLGALFIVLPNAAARATQDNRQTVEAFLSEQFRLTPAELSAITQRKAIARTLETMDGREVATLGVIRIDSPPDFYADQLRNIVEFKRHESVLQIGTFSTPARVEDLASLTLERTDVEALRNCWPGDCDVQLSSEAIRRVRDRVNWNVADAAEQANRVMRELLVELVNAYRESGDAALMVYEDTARPLSVAQEFRAMIASKPAMLERFPALHRHVTQFPGSSVDEAEDVIYWSKEKMGPKVIVTVTHMAIVRLDDSAPATYGVASKQIYATHYFDSSLGLTLLLNEDGRPSAHTYMVYVNRSRLDALGGFFAGLKRAVVRSRTRSATAASLVQARNIVEHRFSLRPGQLRKPVATLTWMKPSRRAEIASWHFW